MGLTAARHQLQYINFMKNLAIVRGFLVPYTRSVGRLSLDLTGKFGCRLHTVQQDVILSKGPSSMARGALL